MPMCGGAGSPKPADEEVQNICETVKAELEVKAGRQFQEFTAHTVSTQLVAGMNYFVKIHVGSEEYIHVRIFKPLPNQGKPTIHAFQLNKTKDDELAYFQSA